MSFFSFVETFFFISLAITFVLIMMLVYHFKDRLSTLEKKSNTIVDIINNVVKELTIIKQQVTYNQIVPFVDIQPTAPIVQSPMQRIQVIEDEFSSDSESDISESDDSELDSDDDSTIYENRPEQFEISLHNNEEHENENIKRINVNLSQNSDIDEVLGDILEIQKEDIDVEELQEEIKLNENEPPIIINKLDESVGVNESEPILEESVSTNQVDSEIYRKMEVGALRALVISKGLASDTKKMKKPDLIRLLETAQE